MDYKKLLEEKELRPASVKLYSIKLKQLDKELDNKEKNLNFLLNTDNVINYVNTLNSTDNKLANYNAILKVIDDSNAIKVYEQVRNDLNKVKFDKYKNNVQTENFIDYKELLQASPAPDFTKSLQDVINDTMLYFSVRYPIRLLLNNIIVVRNKSLMNDKNQNYLYITNNGISFVLNNFKNVKQMGKQTIKLYDDDATIVRNYLKFLKKNNVNSNQFILNYYLKPLEYNANNPDMYARNLKKLLKQRTGKDITMNNVRSSFESALIQSEAYKNMTNEEKTQHHARLLHSPFIAQLTYNKVSNDKKDNKCKYCGK